MKNLKISLSLAIGFVIGGITFTLKNESQKVYLPEEWKLIDKNTPITAYVGKDSILHVEIENKKILFVWDGLEQDIPEDGDQLINLSTNENVVHLNPVD